MSLKSKIQALIAAANAKTGEADATLTDAVQSLVDGYGGGSLPSSISKIDGGSFTVASDTVGSVYNISHNLGVAPKGFFIWTDELNAFQTVSHKANVRALVSTDDFYASESSMRYVFTACLQRNTNGSTYNQLDAISYANQDTLWSNANNICYYKSDTYYIAGCTYKWIAWA